MSLATRYKYIAVFVNVIIISASLAVLFLLYWLASAHNLANVSLCGAPENSTTTTTTESNAWRENEQNIEDKRNKTSVDETKTGTLAKAASADGGRETTTTAQLLLAKRDALIATAFVAYLLAIASCISIGLEHVALLCLLVILFAVIFSVTLTLLVFSFLASMFETQLFRLDFFNSLLLSILIASALQTYSTAFLIYELYLERRMERLNEYSLTKMIVVHSKN